MDELIRLIGLTLRLPFFVAGMLLSTAYVLVFGGISGLWFFLVLPVTWGLIKVPATFFSISFRGSGTEQLKQRISADVSRWEGEYTAHFAPLPDLYRGLYRWLMEGSG